MPSMRRAFSAALQGAPLVTHLSPKLVVALGGSDPALGWTLTMVCWGIAAALIFGFTFSVTHERVKLVQAAPATVRQDLADLRNNLP